MRLRSQNPSAGKSPPNRVAANRQRKPKTASRQKSPNARRVKNKNDSVSLLLITSNKNKLSQIDINTFNAEYGGLIVKIDDRHHDRYLIIDGYLFYHLGSSVNYLGKKLSQITKIEDEDIKNLLRKRINE